jgi:hypothetical protein
MSDKFALIKASTLNINDATVRITQIRRRPSLDIPFLEDPPEWYDHFIKNYHAPGFRKGQVSYSPDKLTETRQIYWISEEKWLAASNHDPVAVENELRHIAYCKEHGISHTRIREIKKDGRWWANVITQVDEEWVATAIGDLVVPSRVLLPGETPVSLIVETAQRDAKRIENKNGNDL